MAGLDERVAVAPGLFVFRCVVTVALFEPATETLETGDSSQSTHYTRSFGVTAESYRAAAEILEALEGRAPDEATEPDGWLDGIEMVLTQPTSARKSDPALRPVTERGVHFVSGKIFYNADEAEN